MSGGVQLHQALEAVVAVDDPAIQVVEVGGGEPAAVQLHHGAQLRGITGSTSMTIHSGLLPDRRKASTTSSRFTTRAFFWPETVLQLGVELLAQALQIHLLQKLLHGLGAHAGIEVILILLPHIPVFLLGEDLVLGHQGRLAGIGDDIGGEVQHLLQNPGADVQQQAHPGGDALEIPDMG